MSRRDLVGAGAALAAVGMAGVSAQNAQAQPAAKARHLGEDLVQTTVGQVRGYTDQKVHVFKGLPYGGSPAGSQRFLPATPPQPWAGVRRAVDYGPASPQAPLPSSTTLGQMKKAASNAYNIFGLDAFHAYQDEDCLTLNVWSPGLGDAKLRPVMFRIHGGGFMAGSGAYGWIDGANLALGQDVVVVTVSHRLNALGYLYLGGVDKRYAAGNVGMTDLVLALQWVRDNIAAFGGDPANVTIFGESGGGAKISTLLAMPSAKGLFTHAVIESGAMLRATPKADADAYAQKFLAALDIAPGDLGKLETVSIEALFDAQKKLGPPLPGPVVDGVTLLDHPGEAVAKGASADIPLIVGSNQTEGTMLRDAVLDKIMAIDAAGLETSVGKAFGPERAPAILAAYRERFPKASPGELFTLIETGAGFRRSAIEFAEQKLKGAKAPVYMYLLEWRTGARDGKLMSPHGLEVPLVMANVDRGGTWVSDYPESRKVSAAMSGSWAAFARTGKPDAPGLAWAAYTVPKRATMVFDVASHVVDAPYDEWKIWADQPPALAAQLPL